MRDLAANSPRPILQARLEGVRLDISASLSVYYAENLRVWVPRAVMGDILSAP